MDGWRAPLEDNPSASPSDSKELPALSRLVRATKSNNCRGSEGCLPYSTAAHSTTDYRAIESSMANPAPARAQAQLTTSLSIHVSPLSNRVGCSQCSRLSVARP